MDKQLKSSGGPQRPQIPEILVEATVRAIKEGMKVDEFARAALRQNQEETAAAAGAAGGVEAKTTKCCKVEQTLKSSRFRKDLDAPVMVREEDEDQDQQEPERTYRNLDERRGGILIIGDQHRFAGGKAPKFMFAGAAPLDYSFCRINKIEEIVTEGTLPQISRNFRAPEKTADDRYKTSSVWLSYNVIREIDGLVNLLYKNLDGGPLGLCWLDCSFNSITKLDEDQLAQIPNLQIFYIHGNCISDMTEVPKLKVLKQLNSLTLHGNPIEEEEGYRVAVIYYLPKLLHLDFVGVTKADRVMSHYFGAQYEPYWRQRHGEFETIFNYQKEAAAVSYTDKVLADDSLDDDGLQGI